MNKLILQDSQGNHLHCYVYPALISPAKAVVHIIHGASEHFARYGLFAEFLNQNGYEVVGVDFLAHGLSAQTYDYVHYSDKNGDVLAYEGVTLVQDYIKANYPSLPVFLLGHSMGSFLARKALIDRPGFYQKAVISGTAFVPGSLSAVGKLLCKIIAAFKGPKYVSPLIQGMAIDANPTKMRKDGIIKDRNVEWLTKDVQIQNYYESSPMCGQPFTVAANKDMFTWLSYVNNKKNIARSDKQTKLLFISGAHDALGGYGSDVRKLAELFQTLGHPSTDLKIYDNDRHEILNETDKDVVYKDILQFFQNE
jgi:alpha-beta hydrolase superfamily lysophospholipase